MSTTLDEVYETVRDARAEGPDAIAAMALSFGATMVLGVVRCRALRGQIAEMCAALEATEATVATLRAERDAAREALAAQDSAPDLDYPARAEVWRLREVVEALRVRAERAEADRDRAVQEREAFSLRLSAAEHARDENRNAWAEACRERDALRARPTYEARTVAPTPEELAAHEAAGARWLRCGSGRASVVCVYRTTDTGSRDGLLWLPLGADDLPCAWPVPAAEVSP